MIKNVKSAPSRRVRGAPQYMLALGLMAYLAFAWHYAESLLMLVEMEMIKPSAGLLMVAGTVFLAIGVARSLYHAPLGKYCLALAAAELALAAPQIGNWGYKLSRSMLATLLFGCAIALAGAWLAYRAGKR